MIKIDLEIEKVEKVEKRFESAIKQEKQNNVFDLEIELMELNRFKEKIVKKYQIKRKIELINKNKQKKTFGDKVESNPEIQKFQNDLLDLQMKYYHLKDEKFFQDKMDKFMLCPIFYNTVLKIEIGNKFMIKANFLIKEKFGKVLELLNEFLIDLEDYYLFQPPFNNNKLSKKHEDKTLKELGVIENTKLVLKYFNPKKGNQRLLKLDLN